jgi:hypothetical protein
MELASGASRKRGKEGWSNKEKRRGEIKDKRTMYDSFHSRDSVDRASSLHSVYRGRALTICRDEDRSHRRLSDGTQGACEGRHPGERRAFLGSSLLSGKVGRREGPRRCVFRSLA